MMCDECGKNPATVRIITVTDGAKVGEKLCSECWRRRNLQVLGQLSPGEMLAKLLGIEVEMDEPELSVEMEEVEDEPEWERDWEEEEEEEEESGPVCPKCGTSYSEFRRTGMLGCADCYIAFEKLLEDQPHAAQGGALHMGRAPEQPAEEMDAQRRVDTLRRQMVAAIKMEDFERAAALRDEIKAMELADIANEMKGEQGDE